jgi:hypothetical protein
MASFLSPFEVTHPYLPRHTGPFLPEYGRGPG